MKLIFDNEEQYNNFILYNCVCEYGLRDTGDCENVPDCCKSCWENSSAELMIDTKLKTEDAVKVKRLDKDRYLIDIPPSGDYVEILGHKIYGNWN